MDPSSSPIWTLILVITALLLALVVCAQILTTYTVAYLAAPREIAVFLDAVDFSILENESYERDVARVRRLDDKRRLGRLLREIQKGGDDVREDLNRLLVAAGGASLRIGARLLWASHRKMLEERVRRLDLLRTRFLVVYMGIIAAMVTERDKEKEAIAEKTATHDVEKVAADNRDPHRSKLPKAQSDSLKRMPSPMKMSTPTMGHSQTTGEPHRVGWMGVVQELQRSPILAKRHASIEGTMAMKSPPMSPLSGPLGGGPLLNIPSPTSLD
ncbi:hypothetical protein DL764_006889 [Monosporascus ibericus]|uniref:Uncharacterized protein n=1 Tax=Monosporascus ibericus TaxID=155417 RepID=A0A4Q4T5J3_9PEZI|nr:hypothetical protein DL764_006889 [Monosporascus ibericus]